MRSDIDPAMMSADLDALLVSGPGDHNPAMVYLTGGGHFTASVVKPRGAAPVIFGAPIEREEIAATGLPSRLHRELKSGPQAQAEEMRWMLKECGVASGRVALHGRVEAGQFLPVLDAFRQTAPEYQVVAEGSPTVLQQARTTKDADEVERIRKMGAITTSVVGKVADFLTTRPVRQNQLLNKAGEPLRLREVKALINLWLAEAGAENPEGTIFAIGRDAAIPHNAGNPEDVIGLGKTIIFDIFPCEQMGGYFYDFTRTWCLGHAPDDAVRLYEDVLSVYQQLVDALRIDQRCKDHQALTCRLFEERGHPTLQSHPGTTDGYVHSIGHGLGLEVHEAPWFSMNVEEETFLQPGSVFTVEPGLYYPDRGMGVRLEDTYAAHADGRFEVLAPYPLDLVLPVRKS